MTNEQMNEALLDGALLARKLADAIPHDTLMLSVVTGCIEICVYTAKRIGMDKLTVQKLLIKLWDTTEEPKA